MVINKGVISKIKPLRDLKVEEIKETLKIYVIHND